MDKTNVFLLPSTASALESDIASFMQKKDFSSALEKLELLLSYQHYTYPVYRDTLTCMIKLQLTDDAIELCEALLEDSSEHYYDFLEIYMMLLYETENYASLIERFEREVGEMPANYVGRIQSFKTLALQMRKWQQEEGLIALMDAVRSGDSQTQYRHLKHWQLSQFPVADVFKTWLSAPSIHPVIKTELLLYMQQLGIQESLTLEKLGESLFIEPASMVPLTQHESYLTCLSLIEDVERQNPSLYLLAKEIIDHHAFVLYPFLYKQSSVKDYAEAAIAIATSNFGMSDHNENSKVAKEMLQYQMLYQEIVMQ